MTKTFCDICGKEGKVLTIDYPCHLDPSGKWGGYVDMDMNPVSGRNEYMEACRGCHNLVYGALVQKIVDLKAEFGKE